VELDLWTRHDVSAAAGDAAGLAALVARLTPARIAADLPVDAASLSAWTHRSHEVLEDALRDSLTGDDDYGSATDLASVTADEAPTPGTARAAGAAHHPARALSGRDRLGPCAQW
jgi:hypothetical protein